MFTGTGFAHPSSGTLPNSAINGKSTVPIRSACTIGLNDTRPSSRAVGSPRRSAVYSSEVRKHRPLRPIPLSCRARPTLRELFRPSTPRNPFSPAEVHSYADDRRHGTRDGTIDQNTGILTGNLYVAGRDPYFTYEHGVALAQTLNKLRSRTRLRAIVQALAGPIRERGGRLRSILPTGSPHLLLYFGDCKYPGRTFVLRYNQFQILF